MRACQVALSANKTRRDLEDAKDVLSMFDAVLVSERLGEPGVMAVMEAVFGAAARGLAFPSANRGLFTHGACPCEAGSKEKKGGGDGGDGGGV